MNRKKLFYKCLVGSLVLHGAAVWVFYTQPVVLQPILTSVLGKASPAIRIPLEDEDINLSEKNIALEEVFNQIIVLSPSLSTPYDMQKNMAALAVSRPAFETPHSKVADQMLGNLPPPLKLERELSTKTPHFTAASDLLDPVIPASMRASPITSPVSLSKKPRLDIVHELQKHITPLELGSNEEKDLPILAIHYPPKEEALGVKKEILGSSAMTSSLPLIKPELMALVTLSELSNKAPDFSPLPYESHYLSTPRPDFAEGSAAKQLPSLAAYGLPESLSTLEWSDDFIVETKVLKEEEGGYFFSITLLPKYEMASRKMPQNYYFLIDRTNSIEKHRYQTFKKAVARALPCLKEGDHFNIVIFDTKVVTLSEKPLPVSKKSLHLAEEFLGNESHGHTSAATDIYRKLSDILPESTSPDQETSIILITDGDSSLNAEKQGKLTRAILQKNHGLATIYTAAVGQGNNLAMLDLLSAFGRGSLLYSDTHAAFPRKLASLVIGIRNPIAKEIDFHVSTTDPTARLCLFPTPSHLPTFFSDRPYTLYGMCDHLCSFNLILQGRNKNQPLMIKKTITLSAGKTDIKGLKKERDRVEAHLYYEKFLDEGKVAHLDKAKELLSK